MSPKKINLKNGRIVSMEFTKTERDEDGNWYDDADQTMTLKADWVCIRPMPITIPIAFA